MEALIAIIIFVGVWYFVARSLKGKGFITRHIAGCAASFICIGVFAVTVGPTTTNTDNIAAAQHPETASNSVKTSDTAPNSIQAKEAAAPQEIAVTSSTLFSDYEENEVAADQKYKGKALRVNGTVQSIDKDAFDNIVIKLKTSNPFMATNAYLDDKHEQLAAELKKNQKIVFVCAGDGLMIGSPMLRDCVPG